MKIAKRVNQPSEQPATTCRFALSATAVGHDIACITLKIVAAVAYW